jgi:hypothetical protein
MATGDLKSVYFHVPIYKDAWKYFGFRIGKLTFFFKVLPFEFAQARYVFTEIMQGLRVEKARSTNFGIY